MKEQVCAAAAANTEIGGDYAGTGGLVYYPSNTNWLNFLYAFGGAEVNADGTAYDFTSQAAIDASLFILDLKADGCVWQTESYPNPEQAQRKALITMSSTAGAPYYAAAFEDAGNTTDVWGWIAAPGPDGNLAVDAFNQMLGVVPSTADREMASWLFVKWLTSPEIRLVGSRSAVTMVRSTAPKHCWRIMLLRTPSGLPVSRWLLLALQNPKPSPPGHPSAGFWAIWLLNCTMLRTKLASSPFSPITQPRPMTWLQKFSKIYPTVKKSK